MATHPIWRVFGLAALFCLASSAVADLETATDTASGPRLSADYKAKHCIFSKYGLVTANQPGRLLDNYQREAPDKPLVIYFHGGLVDEDSGVGEAAYLSQLGFSADVCYPLFMIWNSGVTTELLNQDGLPRAMRIPAVCPPSITKDSDDTKTALNWSQPVCMHVWDSCKRDIWDAFNLSNGRGVGTRLISAIGNHHVSNRIVLVGHSAGAIYILAFLEAARVALPDIQFDVVFLAPACSYAYTSAMLTNWNDRGYQPFRTFRMFALSDEAERRNHLVSDVALSNLLQPLVGGLQDNLSSLMPWSLLYFVSKDLEHRPNTPLLGMEYFFKSQSAATDWQHDLTLFSLFADPRDNVVCPSPNGEPGCRSGVTKHSGFFEDSPTRESLHAIVAEVAKDPVATGDFIRLKPDSLPTTVQAFSEPKRHFVLDHSTDGLTIDLDRLGVALPGGSTLARTARGEFTSSTPGASDTVNTITCTLPVRIYKSDGCTVSIRLVVNGVETLQEVADAVGSAAEPQIVNVVVVAPLGADDSTPPVKASFSITATPQSRGAVSYAAAGTMAMRTSYRNAFAVAAGWLRAKLDHNVVVPWVFDGLFALLFFLTPVRRLVRVFPMLPPTPGAPPPSLEACQTAYLKRARLATIFAIAMPLIAVYLWVMAAIWQPEGDTPHNDLLIMAGLAAALAMGHAAGVIWYARAGRRLAVARPELAECRGGIWMSVLSAIIYVLPCSIFIAGVFIGGDFGLTGGYLLACLIYVVLIRLTIKLLVKRQDPIDPESPLGLEIQRFLRSAGVEPKRLVRIRSLLANGFALPDGTITVTTMLAAMTSEREVAAVLAHELSHAVDKDPKRLKKALLLAMIPVVAVLVVVILLAGAYRIQGPFVLPAIIASALATLRPLMFFYQRTSRRLEYKCDAYAASLGYGPDLASGLVMLHRIMGLPHKWVGVDRFTITHPSLDDRLAALGAVPA